MYYIKLKYSISKYFKLKTLFKENSLLQFLKHKSKLFLKLFSKLFCQSLGKKGSLGMPKVVYSHRFLTLLPIVTMLVKYNGAEVNGIVYSYINYFFLSKVVSKFKTKLYTKTLISADSSNETFLFYCSKFCKILKHKRIFIMKN